MNDKFAEIQSAANAGAFGINGYALPSVEQCRAGNYRKGRVKLYGLDIAIETPQGTRRMGKSDGKPWSVICMAHYGDISGTIGADGDPVDCYVGPVPESTRVFVVNQNGKTGAFDEHKVMLAFPDEEAARTAYMNSYEPGWTGLGSMVSASVDQFTWWLRYGNTALPFSKTALPYHGDDDMNELHWDSAAQPVNTDLASVMYGLRRGDPDQLLLDAATLADIHEDADSLDILDALVVESQKLEPKLAQLQRIMEAAGGQVKPVALQISQPFKQKGTTNITALYELSDGQTVAIFFHNPDSTPNKILPTDEMVSWKWLLNKLDVTILVAPEKGRDLNPREVARRIMTLAEKNSTKFAKANGARAERMAAIEQAKAGVSGKEATLAALDAEIADLTVKVEAKRAIQPPVPGGEQGGAAPESFNDMARRLVPAEFVADIDPDGFMAMAADGYGIRLRMTGAGRMLATYIIQPGVTGQNSLGAKSVRDDLESAMSGSVNTAVTTIAKYRVRSQPIDVLQLAEAMKKVDNDGMWYNDPVVNELVNRAVEQGYAFRQSTTQAGWTTAGIEALKAARAAQEPVIDWAQAQELDSNEAIRGLGVARINEIGSENVYVEKGGKPFMFKPGNTDAYAIGEHDFSNDATFAVAPKPSAPSRLDWDEALYAALEARELSRSDVQGVVEAQQDAVDAAFAAGTDPAEVAAQLLGGGFDDNAAEIAGVEAILKSTNWVKRSANTWDRGAWQVTIQDGTIQVNEYQDGDLVERGVVPLLGDEGGTVKAIEKIVSTGGRELTAEEQADVAEQAKYQPFDRSKVKMPTAVQLNLNAKGMPILIDYDGQNGWSNGNILAFDKPKLVTDAITKYHVDEQNLRRIGKDQVDRVTPNDATIPLEPTANFEDVQESQRSTVSKLQTRPQVKISAVVLINQESGVGHAVDARFFGYFDKVFKKPDYYASRDPQRAIVVKKGGKIVGLIMPMRVAGDALKRAARAAGVDGQVTPVANGWETNSQSGPLRRDTLTKQELGSVYELAVGGQYGSGYWNITKDGKEVRFGSDLTQMSFAQMRARAESAFYEYLASEHKRVQDEAPKPHQEADAILSGLGFTRVQSNDWASPTFTNAAGDWKRYNVRAYGSPTEYRLTLTTGSTGITGASQEQGTYGELAAMQAVTEARISEAKEWSGQAPSPAAQDGQLAAARELLQSVIDGTTAMDAGLADRLQAAYDQFAGDAEFDALFEQAALVFADAMVAKARSALAA